MRWPEQLGGRPSRELTARVSMSFPAAARSWLRTLLGSKRTHAGAPNDRLRGAGRAARRLGDLCSPADGPITAVILTPDDYESARVHARRAACEVVLPSGQHDWAVRE